jgi:hypothetical protein
MKTLPEKKTIIEEMKEHQILYNIMCEKIERLLQQEIEKQSSISSIPNSLNKL